MLVSKMIKINFDVTFLIGKLRVDKSNHHHLMPLGIFFFVSVKLIGNVLAHSFIVRYFHIYSGII